MAADSTGTRTDPLPNNTNKVEPKVYWGALFAWIAGAVGLFLFDLVTANNNAVLVDALPDVVEWLVLPLIPAIGSFIAGFAARHQYRRAEVQGSLPPGAHLD